MSTVSSTNATATNPTITASSITHLFGKFLSSASIWSSNSSGVLSVNTQARRLGCLTYLLGLVSRGRKVESMLLSLSPSEVALLRRNIDDNGFTSGYLTTNESSVRHYINAAIGFHLLAHQGAVFELSVRGRFLLEAIKPDWERPYPLGVESKVFFLHALLGFDYFGIAALIRSLLRGTRKISELKKQHQSQLSELLEVVSRTTPNARLQRSVRDRLISVRSWRKPESYCEHLVSAKLNWLADLGILQLPPSSTSSLSLASEHVQWLGDWASAVEPTEAHLLALLLRYAQVAVPKAEVRTDEGLCSALQMAFSRLAGIGRLAKIRVSDFILFLVCFHPHLLIQFGAEEIKFFSQSVSDGKGSVYKAHAASRSTQSYIVREEMGGR